MYFVALVERCRPGGGLVASVVQIFGFLQPPILGKTLVDGCDEAENLSGLGGWVRQQKSAVGTSSFRTRIHRNSVLQMRTGYAMAFSSTLRLTVQLLGDDETSAGTYTRSPAPVPDQ